MIFPGIAMHAPNVGLVTIAPDVGSLLENLDLSEALIIAVAVDGLPRELVYPLSQVGLFKANAALRLVGYSIIPCRGYLIHRSWIKLVVKKDKISGFFNMLHFFNFSIRFAVPGGVDIGFVFQFFPPKIVAPDEWNVDVSHVFMEDVSAELELLELIVSNVDGAGLVIYARDSIPIWLISASGLPRVPLEIVVVPANGILSPDAFVDSSYFRKFNYAMPVSAIYFDVRPRPVGPHFSGMLSERGIIFPERCKTLVSGRIEWEWTTIAFKVHRYAVSRYSFLWSESGLETIHEELFIRSFTRGIFVCDLFDASRIVYNVADNVLVGLVGDH